jgi:hypothetical protein
MTGRRHIADTTDAGPGDGSLTDMPAIEVVLGDITQENVDAIVNAANSSLRGGLGVDELGATSVAFDERTRDLLTSALAEQP